jgi:hypothetical protein
MCIGCCFGFFQPLPRADVIRNAEEVGRGVITWIDVLHLGNGDIKQK